MGSTATLSGYQGTQPIVVNTARLSNMFIGLAVFLGGFVLFEPAPYELCTCRTTVCFFPVWPAAADGNLSASHSSDNLHDRRHHLLFHD